MCLIWWCAFEYSERFTTVMMCANVCSVLFIFRFIQYFTVTIQRVTTKKPHENRIEFVDRLFSNYSKRFRPHEVDNESIVTDVRINIRVVSLSSVNIQDMDYTIDIYLRQLWNDQRLQYSGYNGTISAHNSIEKIWLPDVFFRNAKAAHHHTVTVPNVMIRISPNGNVFYSQKLTLKLHCPMHLHKYPMDSQLCPINIGTYAYGIDEIRLRWLSAKESGVEPVVCEEIQVPEFEIAGVDYGECNRRFESTGAFNCLMVHFRLNRLMGYYIINVYAPFVLIVTLSWSSFWINLTAVPARVTVGLLTVLGILTHNAATHVSGMPKVSYVKAIDVYMIITLIAVTGALMEFVLAYYLDHQDSLRHLRTRTEATSQRTATYIHPINSDSTGAAKQSSGDYVDRVSRILFPLSFTLVNVVYWSLYATR